MQTEAIQPHDLPSAALYGVLVEGVPVYRTAQGWRVHPAHLQAMWTGIQAAMPEREGDRAYHGSLPAAGYTGHYTARQAETYRRRHERLVTAARNSAHARAQRAEREAARRARSAAAYTTALYVRL